MKAEHNREGLFSKIVEAHPIFAFQAKIKKLKWLTVIKFPKLRLYSKVF